MGRLLRKKDPVKKIKKSQVTDESGQEASSADEPLKRSPAERKPFTAGIKPVVVKQEKNFIDKGVQFLREVKVELKKVTWPSRKQTLGSTVVVLIIVTIISLFLGVVDAGLSSLIRAVLQ